MSKIRKVYYFDKKNGHEMMSFLNNNVNDTYVNHIMFNPLIPLHHLLPLKLKFLPESYVLKDNHEIKGLITVAPARCPSKQMEIQKLLFEENCYEAASELVQYVVSKYKAMGTASFIVRIDDCLPELINMFVSKCGFSQISSEKLWHIKKIDRQDYIDHDFREYEPSDNQTIANIYNDDLLPHFRPLLGKNKKEFRDFVFKGLSYISEYKYIMQDSLSKTVIAFVSIQTADNENYILDIIPVVYANIDIKQILFFANNQIMKRKKNFNLFLKTKKYSQFGLKCEHEFPGDYTECIQNQIVLTNSSAKIIRDEAHSGRFTVLDRFYGGISVVNNHS